MSSKKMNSARSDLTKIQKELKEFEGNRKKIMKDNIKAKLVKLTCRR